MIQTIDEIIDQYTPYSKSIPTWDREDIKKMMKEYAIEIVDYVIENIRDIVQIELDLSDMDMGKVIVINGDKVNELKQQIENEQV